MPKTMPDATRQKTDATDHEIMPFGIIMPHLATLAWPTDDAPHRRPPVDWVRSRQDRNVRSWCQHTISICNFQHVMAVDAVY